MRLVIHEQLDITGEQRVRMADVIDQKITKRQATREEMKEWVWSYGSNWARTFDKQWEALFGQVEDGPIDDEDLLGLDDVDQADLDLEDLL